MGPEICKRTGYWAKFYKSGQNISADGTQIRDAENDAPSIRKPA